MAEEVKSEQTKEIEAALSGTVNEADEWTQWTQEITAAVDKLIDGRRMDRYAIFAIGAVGLCAIGATTALYKIVQGMGNALGQIANNQNFLAEKMGLTAQQPTQTVEAAPANNGKHAVEEIRVEDAKTFDLPKDAAVAEPFEGPATEASEAAKEQLKADKAAGIIDEFKGQDEDAL
jgi:hypothetical protein